MILYENLSYLNSRPISEFNITPKKRNVHMFFFLESEK